MCTWFLLVKGQKCGAFILNPYWLNWWIISSEPALLKLMYVSFVNNFSAVLWSFVSIAYCIWSHWSFSAATIFGQSLANESYALHLRHLILYLLVLALEPDPDLLLLLSSLLKLPLHNFYSYQSTSIPEATSIPISWISSSSEVSSSTIFSCIIFPY